MTEIDLVVLVWRGMLGAPPVAAIVFLIIQKRLPRAHRTFFIFSGVWLFLTMAAKCLGISFVDATVNSVWAIVAYGADCYLAVSCWLIARKLIRIPALIVMAIPVGCFYFLGTIGALALLFITGDYVRAPSYVEVIRPGLTCKVTDWGMAASDEGQIVALYRSWRIMPFIERRVSSVDADVTAGEAVPSCKDLAAKYHFIAPESKK